MTYPYNPFDIEYGRYNLDFIGLYKYPFLSAVMNGDFAEVKKLLEEDPTRIHTRSNSGLAALEIAADLGRMEIAKYLLENGAEVSNDALRNAHNRGFKKMVALLREVEKHN